ncbi:MAG: hypothetical protein ACRDRJ_35970 [Streptosporangiaceae bacterium]
MAAKDEPCHLGGRPNPCAYDHVAARLPRGREGTKSVRLCPCHDDTKASLSINPGDETRVIWRCGAECDPGDIRAALLEHGADPSCLGNYGLPKRHVQPGMRIQGYDPGLVADAKRWIAVSKLPRGLSGHLYRMCIQAISEGDGDLPGDPLGLLPVGQGEFVGLARQAGIERSYAYKLWIRWLQSAA